MFARTYYVWYVGALTRHERTYNARMHFHCLLKLISLTFFIPPLAYFFVLSKTHTTHVSICFVLFLRYSRLLKQSLICKFLLCDLIFSKYNKYVCTCIRRWICHVLIWLKTLLKYWNATVFMKMAHLIRLKILFVLTYAN